MNWVNTAGGILCRGLQRFSFIGDAMKLLHSDEVIFSMLHKWLLLTFAVSFLTEDQFLLLQSLVMACQSHDLESLCSLEAELWCHLTSEQKDLLRTLVRKMSNGTK
jgi:hypothetical protein